MSEREHLNPTGRFTGLADVYAKYRPGYPDAALDYLLGCCGLTAASLVVDVGCGTGISSRLLAGRGLRVLGIEPNAEMRARAAAAAVPLGQPAPEYRDGRAEATGLPDADAHAVLAAQAFHWFEPEATLREFHRILRPAGWAVLLWNLRDETDPFTAAYGEVIRSAPGVAGIEGEHGRSGEVLLHSPLFPTSERVRFPNEQVLDEDGVLGRAFSASYAPREEAQARPFADGLRAAFTRFQTGGKVRLCYVCVAYLGQKAGGRPETG
jgi:SAM-dependent methyltransferase